MTNWTHNLELKDLHNKHESGEMGISQVASTVAIRLKALIATNTPPISEDLKEEAEELAERFENEIDDVEDYDNVLSDLYDWADTELPCKPGTPFTMEQKLCWVNTF